MKLVVGLGNVGKTYNNTRHNVGFMSIDAYVKHKGLIAKEKFNGEYYEEIKNDEKIIYLKPLSYMNNSGKVVFDFVNYFKIATNDIFVIYDDMDFEVGCLKLKATGTSGGHNGIKNILEYLKTDNIHRLRIGISKNKKNIINYVLGTFTKKEKAIIDEVIHKVIHIIDDYPTITFENLMNKYN